VIVSGDIDLQGLANQIPVYSPAAFRTQLAQDWVRVQLCNAARLAQLTKVTSFVCATPAVRPGAAWYCQYRFV